MARVLCFVACVLLFFQSAELQAQGWFPQASGTSKQLYGVSFANATHGTAVGVSGTIRRTTNGGTNWTGQSSGTSVTLYEVVLIDPSTGWIVGGNGTILKTTNGGANWIVQPSGTSADLTCVQFASATVGTAVGGNGVVLRTTNGGLTWTSQASGTTADLWGVSFVDANTGIAVGGGGKILRTTNGGTTWVMQTSGTSADLWEAFLSSGTTGYAVGNGGTILRTTNGGTTWTSQSSGTGVPLYHVFFRTPSKGTAVGVSGTILHTTNGGTTWSGQSSGVSQPLHEVVFSDENTGTAVGVSGTILRTLTGGFACPVITINPSTLPAGQIGAVYSASLTATGGVAPHEFAVTSGVLPPGLSLSAGGGLSGIPTTSGTYAFTVTASDENNCQGIRTYTIQVLCPPLTVTPDTLLHGAVGASFNQTLAASAGLAPYTFSIASGSLPSGLTLSAGGLISGTPTTAGTATFTTLVTDAAGCTTTKAYSLIVACPSISLIPPSLPPGTSGSVYSQTVGASGGSSPYTFAVSSGTLPPGTTMSGTGVVGGSPSAVGSFTFDVRATDAQGCTGTASYTINIVCPTVTINPTTLPGGAVGTAYSGSLTATGGSAPYTYAITSGSIPPGLTFSTAGVLSGSPTTAGSYTFTATVTDAQSCTGTRGYSMQIICPSIQILPAGLAAGTVGSPFSASLSTSGGASPYTYALTSGVLPAGLVLSASGTISGTPTASGSSNFTVTVTDGQGCSGTINYTLIIGCPIIGIAPLSLASGVTGTPYSASITASGGAEPYIYTIASGVLPGGLTLSSGGTVSGIPSAQGTFNFTVTATDANGCDGTRLYGLTVTCAGISISDLTGGVVGISYSQTVTATGGAAPYTYAVTSGSPPPGLTLSGSGVLSGTPVTQGSYTFTITATDAQGCQSNRSYSLQMDCPPIGLSSLPGGTVGVAYSGSVVASGGTAPYSFAVSSGSIPTGLSLSAGGLLSGIPIAGGTFTFELASIDANGCIGTAGYTIVMACTPIVLEPASLQNGTAGVPYSQSISASGGASPYAFTVTSGSLPPGLTLTGSGLLSGMPASEGLYSFVVTGTDAYGCAGTHSYTVDVTTCPTIAVSPTSLQRGSVGSAYTENLSSSGGTAPYTYALSLGALPPGLSLSGAGAVSGTPTASGIYGFTISTTDNAGCVGYQSYTLVVCGTITLSPLPGGVTGIHYSQAIGTAGGTAPFAFSLSSGSLPPGLSFAPSGLIAGVPTSAGSFPFTIEVVDANGCTGVNSYTVVIGCPAILLSPSLLPPGVSGAAYSESITATGGTSPYVYSLSAGSLPPGIVLSSAGLLSGLPGATGSYSFTVQGVDAYGCPSSANFTIDVTCPALSLLPATLSSAVVGSSYATVLTAGGGTAPHLFTITSGSLPTGISLSPTGALTGTPTTSGSFAFTVGVQDARACTGSRNYSLQVDCPTISINPPSLPGGATGSAYHQTLTAVGGTGPYLFAITSGTIPPGLSLSGAGVLSGTPASPGTHAFTVTVADARGCEFTGNYSVAISCPAIVPAPASLPAGQAGLPYSQTMNATGGSAPYSFAVTSGTLPPGITLSPSGVFSGIPAVVGTTGFTITATDGGGCTGTITYALTVNCAAIAMAPSDMPGGTAGSPYSQQLSASGGTIPYGYSIASGTLPSGLTLSSAGLISGSPSASGSTSFSVLVTDAQGCTSVKSFAIAVICPSIGILPGSLAGGVVGSSYSETLAGSGGTAPYSFALASGSLPAGLSLSTSGVLSGLPLTQSVTAFVVGITDANGCQGSQPFIVIVNIAPVFTIEPDSLLFGGILVGESTADTVTVTNSGSGPLTIYSASSTSGHFGVSPLQAVIPAGGSRDFIISFAPGSTGPKSGIVLFTHNAPASPESVYVEGTGTAPVFTVFTMISFGQVHIGSAKLDSVRIVNTGSTTLTISSVVTDHPEFTVFPGSAVLAPGASQVFLTAFVPSTIGSKEGNLIFTHNAIGSPSMIPFSGSGIVNVVVRKFRDADGENQTQGDRFPKRWQLSLYRSEVLPANLVASVDSSELLVPLTDAGTYIAVEADSGGAWSRLNGNRTFADTLLVDGTVTVADTFINFRRNTITVQNLEDIDGNFGTPGDRVLRSWYLELRRDSLGGPTVASGHGGSLVVPNLGDGIYYAIHADSSGWTTIGSLRNGLSVPDTSSAVMILLTEGTSPQIDFLNAREDYFFTFRSFTPEELGQKIPVKKKPHAVSFCAQFVNRVGGAVNGLDITFYSTGLTSNVTTMQSYAPFTGATSYNGKVWQFSGAWIANGETVTVCAVANKSKTVAIASWNWTVNGLPLDKQPAFKPAQQYRLLPMPNFANVRNELYGLGAFNLTKGMIIGIPRPENPKAQGWVRMRTARTLQRSMADRGIRHTAVNHGFDRFESGKPMVKELKELIPKKHNNKLFAEAVALRTGIYASAIGMSPPGFGELVYDETPPNALCGLTLVQISQKVDSALSLWSTPSFLGWDYPLYTAVLERINHSFEGAVDTSGWVAGLVLKGVKRLVDVPFLHPNPNAIPFRIDRAVVADLQPKAFELFQNYPNPFNPTTTIEFDLVEPGFVTLKIFNVLGQEVATLLDREELEPGKNDVELNASDLSSGVYFYRVTVESIQEEGGVGSVRYVDTRKMMLVK